MGRVHGAARGGRARSRCGRASAAICRRSTSRTERSSRRAICSSRSIRVPTRPPAPRRGRARAGRRRGSSWRRRSYARADQLVQSTRSRRRRPTRAPRTVRQAEAGVAGRRRPRSTPRGSTSSSRRSARRSSGRVSRKLVTEGNLITGGVGTQGTLLTTIVSLDPIYVYFEADERAYLKYQRLAQSGRAAELARRARTRCSRPRRRGGLPARGLHGLRRQPARSRHRHDASAAPSLPNPDRLLTPGLFARLRLPGSGTLPGAC